MKALDIINDLCKIGERQLEGLDKSRDYIKNILENNKIDFKIMKYSVKVPRYQKFSLFVDGKK